MDRTGRYYSPILLIVFLLLTQLTHPAGQGFHEITSTRFPDAFEAHPDTVCANTRRGDGLPVAHVTARTVAFLDSFVAGG